MIKPAESQIARPEKLKITLKRNSNDGWSASNVTSKKSQETELEMAPTKNQGTLGESAVSSFLNGVRVNFRNQNVNVWNQSVCCKH